jgi:hypothetical protein
MEDQTFLRSNDSAPCPPLPLSPISKLPLFLSLDRGEGVGEEPNHPTVRAWPSIKHSILCALWYSGVLKPNS